MPFSIRETSTLPWPEPWVIELIGDLYAASPITAATRLVLARRHADVLHDLLGGRDSSWRTARRELVTLCTDLGIGAERVSSIDRAVFCELTRLAAERYRTSPRRRETAGEALKAAVGRLRAYSPQFASEALAA